MAKRKTPKVKDLKPTQISEKELTSLQNLVNALNRTQMEIGSIEARKHMLAHQVMSLQQQLAQTQKTLEETYGKVDINIEDGSITYTEDEQADKKD